MALRDRRKKILRRFGIVAKAEPQQLLDVVAETADRHKYRVRMRTEDRCRLTFGSRWESLSTLLGIFIHSDADFHVVMATTKLAHDGTLLVIRMTVGPMSNKTHFLTDEPRSIGRFRTLCAAVLTSIGRAGHEVVEADVDADRV